MSERRPLDGEVLPPERSGDEARVRRDFWATFKRAARQIPFSNEVVAAYYCAIDPTVPWRVRATLLAALAYFVTPLDAVPDFILGVGFGDDVGVLAAAIAMVATHIAPRHRESAKRALAD